jgi:arylsulfatase A-like enzyme
MISKIELLRTFGILSASLCAILASQVAQSSDREARGQSRPDILLIMPDQMRGDCLSALNHPVVRTPVLDQIARQGTLFRRAYSTVPSCIPARYALLTGLAPKTSGVVGFRKQTITTPCLPQLLQQAGYATALVGREMHQMVADQQLGYQTCVHGSTYVSDDQYAREVAAAFPELGAFRPWVESLGLTYNHWQARPWPLPDHWHPTSWIVRQAREVMQQTDAAEPLLLTASFYAPHPPLFPPKEQFDYYFGLDLPEIARGDWVDWDSLTTAGRDGGHRVLLQDETLRRAAAGYFGLIEHLDQQLKMLVADFQARSARAGRPWLIVVTSDHGEMLGDHGFFRKCEPFEGSANIPFLIAGSADLSFVRGQRCFQPVCLEDILPTLCHLAGAVTPEVDGVDLVPVLRGQPRSIRDYLHFEHAPCYSRAQAFHALTDGHIKYIWRPSSGQEHCFDLDQDPREEHDLSRDSAQRAVVSQWRQKLIRTLADRPERFSDGTKLIAARPYPPLMKKAIQAGRK